MKTDGEGRLETAFLGVPLTKNGKDTLFGAFFQLGMVIGLPIICILILKYVPIEYWIWILPLALIVAGADRAQNRNKKQKERNSMGWFARLTGRTGHGGRSTSELKDALHSNRILSKMDHETRSGISHHATPLSERERGNIKLELEKRGTPWTGADEAERMQRFQGGLFGAEAERLRRGDPNPNHWNVDCRPDHRPPRDEEFI